jgi:hypothetical protein
LKKQIETQHLAVVGFRSWLESSQPAQPEDEDSREFNDQLLHVLQIYGWELERQIEGTLANNDWYNLIALTSMTAALLKDALLEAHPELINYSPIDEPTTVEQMTAKLLFDALVTFEAAQHEMSTYLTQPEFPDVVNGLLQTVLNAE